MCAECWQPASSLFVRAMSHNYLTAVIFLFWVDLNHSVADQGSSEHFAVRQGWCSVVAYVVFWEADELVAICASTVSLFTCLV